jgi:hypothetical protein
VTPAELIELAAESSSNALVVVNPDNGPGAAVQAANVEAISRLRRAGIRVLGYVPTNYGARDRNGVQADITRYSSWYDVRDIFVDEVASTEEALPYYTALTRWLRASSPRLVALNPGRVPAGGYFNLADIVVTFEGPYSDYVSERTAEPNWVRGLVRTRTAHLVYDANDLQALGAVTSPRADYVYVNSGTQPNPWRSIPGTLQEQQARLGRC